MMEENEKESNGAEVGVRLLTVFEVAKRLSVCVRTVRSYIAKGALKVRRVGGAVRVEESEIGRFVQSLPR